MKDFKQFAKEIAMSIIIPLAMAFLLLLFTGVIEVQAEEVTEIGGDLIATEIYKYKTYDRVTTWHLDLESGEVLDNIVFVNECTGSDYTYNYYTAVLTFTDNTAMGTVYMTETITYDNGTFKTEVKEYDIAAYLRSQICDNGNAYIYMPYIGGRIADYSNAGIYTTTLSFNSATYIDTNGVEQVNSQSATMWLEYFNLYDESLNYVPPTIIYSSDIPTPQVVLSQLGEIGFNNKTDDYYIEMQGRWRTAEDIDIYSENLVWKYKFQSRIDSDLTTWVSQDDRRKATEEDLFLTQLGADNFATLLSANPSIERNIYTSNALGEILSGFANQKAQFINYLDNCAFFPINSPEIYVRYYTVDDSGNVEYGKWCHAYVTMPTNGKMSTFTDDLTDGFAYVSTQSDKGLTEDEFTYVEDLEDSRLETDASISNNADGTVYVPDANMDTSQLLNVLTSMFEQSKAFFNLFAQVFSFFPEWLTGLIFSSLGVMVIIGLWKFWRG